MANPLTNEVELYQRIRDENIVIAPGIWDLLYYRIGDDISTINLLCQYYLNCSSPIPSLDAKKILLYTKHIKNIVRDILCTSKDSFAFPEFINDIPLHPVIREILGLSLRKISTAAIPSVAPKVIRPRPE